MCNFYSTLFARVYGEIFSFMIFFPLLVRNYSNDPGLLITLKKSSNLFAVLRYHLNTRFPLTHKIGRYYVSKMLITSKILVQIDITCSELCIRHEASVYGRVLDSNGSYVLCFLSSNIYTRVHYSLHGYTRVSLHAL